VENVEMKAILCHFLVNWDELFKSRFTVWMTNEGDTGRELRVVTEDGGGELTKISYFLLQGVKYFLLGTGKLQGLNTQNKSELINCIEGFLYFEGWDSDYFQENAMPFLGI
jgi:hypothetical protein